MPDWKRGATARPLIAFASLLMLAAPAAAESFSDLKPVTPQPAADSVAPGLAVNYVFVKASHVDDIEVEGGGEPGEVLPQLNYQSGPGNVLTSDRSDSVGALIKGFINFPEPGRWLMVTQSNDGVRVRLAGKVVIEDPDVHSDQYSANAEINVAEPGWYELTITYFERKSTSTLKLLWQPPGKSEFELVPADAFAHLK
jgi:PA14 domain